MKVTDIRHPEYANQYKSWTKFRFVLLSGKDFVDEYLEKYTSREDQLDFNIRKKITYCPSYAKAAVIDIRDSIFSRLVDVKRIGGDSSYQKAVKGLWGGFDKEGATVDKFIGTDVLTELLFMGRVGVYVDRGISDTTLRTKEVNAPYAYIYTAEQILSWSYGKDHKLDALLVTADKETTKFGLTAAASKVYTYMTRTAAGITVTDYDVDGKETATTNLDLPEIPFIIGKLGDSLVRDAADYQIALLNLESSDLIYALKGNFPFYIEQRDGSIDMAAKLQAMSDTANDGTAGSEGSKKKAVAEVGSQTGRSYGKGLDAPSFINPSAEPLTASMAKGDALKRDIRLVVNLSVQQLQPNSESSESKDADRTGLENGLACIAQELRRMEQAISRFWGLYMRAEQALILYPTDFAPRTDKERREEAEEIFKLIAKMPSNAARKSGLKEIVSILYAHKLDKPEIEAMHREIDALPVVLGDISDITELIEQGVLSRETTANALMFPKGEAKKAENERAARAAKIIEAQSNAGTTVSAGARGVDELEVDPDAAKNEKTESQSAENNPDGVKKVRGEA